MVENRVSKNIKCLVFNQGLKYLNVWFTNKLNCFKYACGIQPYIEMCGVQPQVKIQNK